jgi:outer membrane protein TolC
MCESIVDAITSHIKVPYKILPISKTDQETLRDIVSKGDTALILRQPQLSAKETKDFLNNLAELGVRTFSFGNYKDAQLGMMAVNSPDREYTKTARTTAMAIGELISGNRDGGVLKVSRTNSLVINMDAANVAKFSPKWDTKRDAELIGEELIGEQKYIGYKQALEKAVKTNEDVAIGQIDLKTAGDMVQMSKSAFRPTVNLSSTFLRINEDRALVARGTAAENRFDVTLSLKQILYSEEVFSLKDRADINEIAQKSIAKQAELDIIQQTAQAYMNVLRAKTFVSITQDNLERNKTNYNLAKNRDLAGAANPAELHRWEATIAMAKADVSNAKNSVKLAMTELARLMGEDIDDSFMLEQLKLDTDVTIYTTLMNAGYKLENMADFEKFKAAILNISLENSVELKALKQAAKAAQRTVLSAERSFYHPTVALSGEYKRYLDKSGKGSDDPMPGYDDSEWSIALNASLPLYEGGRRTAELNIEKAALRKIYHEKSKATKQIKQRMIAALENSKASFNQHLLAQASAKAAERTTEIASDLYAKGAVSITELIDAQNARLTAEMNVASTRFDFMEKLVTVERAYGSYFIFKTDAEDAEFINNINKNMQ